MRLLLVSTALGLLAAPAMAADIGTVEPLPAPEIVEAAPVNNWTGFYLGALGGFNWGAVDTEAGEVDADGFDIGGYAGANWQWGNFVVGAEGDLLFPFVDGDDAGIALDRFLLYGTGGLAGTELELTQAGVSDDDVLWGWTAGVGGEAMVTDSITARVEYRYTDYEDETFEVAPPISSDFTTHSIRGGVGLKF